MKLTVDALEKERDFYFGKLRDIEVLCQEHENDGLAILTQIMDILYATEVRNSNVLGYLLVKVQQMVINRLVNVIYHLCLSYSCISLVILDKMASLV